MAILLVLGGIAAMYLRTPPEDAADSAQTRLLPALEAKAVQRVSVIYAGVSFALEREPVSELNQRLVWKVQRPYGARASQAIVDRLVSVVAGLKVLNSISEAEQESDQEIYGLVPPQAVIRLEDKSGKYIVSLGKEQKLSGRRYAQLQNEGRIVLLDEQQFIAITELIEQVRPKKLLGLAPAQVRGLVATNIDKNSLIAARRSADGTWSVRGTGPEFKADTRVIEDTLHKLLNTPAVQLHDLGEENAHFFGLNQPSLLIAIALDSKDEWGIQEYTLRFTTGVAVIQRKTDGKLEPQIGSAYYAKVGEEPTVYQYDRPIYAPWLGDAAYFRPRRPFREIASDQVSRIGIAAEEGRSVILPSAKLTQDSARKMYAELVQALIGLEVISYPESNPSTLAAAGLEAPYLVISGEGDGVKLNLKIGKEIGTRRTDQKTASQPELQAPRYAEVSSNGEQPVIAVLSPVVVAQIDRLCRALISEAGGGAM